MPALDVRRSVRNVQSLVMMAVRRLVKRYPSLRTLARGVYDRLPGAVVGVDKGDVEYGTYRAAVTPDAAALAELRAETATWEHRPLVSVLVAVYDPTPAHLRACVASVQAQAYERWELCLAEDRSPTPETWDLVRELAATDERIRCEQRTENGGISAATNTALAMARGEYSVLLDHDDLLEPDALAEVVRVLQDAPETDFVYTDEDKVTDVTDQRLEPHFKPGWSPEMLQSGNYITHLACIRTSLLRDLGGFDSAMDGAQDWDMFLRVGAVTDRIRHVPRVLYAWRVHERSTALDMETKPYAVAAQRRALEKSVAAAGGTAEVRQDEMWPAYWHVRYPVVGEPLVSVVVVAREGASAVQRCVASVLKRSTWTNLEVVVVEPGEPVALPPDARVRTVGCSQPGLAAALNQGVSASNGEIVVLLDDSCEVHAKDWLETLTAEVQRPGVGAAGCLLLYPGRGLIHHAGVSLGVGDAVAVNVLQDSPAVVRRSMAQHMQLYTRRDTSAVTGECLAIRREVWDELDGLDESLPLYADVDLCCRLAEAGYRVVYTPYADLVHHGFAQPLWEGDEVARAAAVRHFQDRWPDLLQRDPYRNPNLGGGRNLSLVLPTRPLRSA